MAVMFSFFFLFASAIFLQLFNAPSAYNLSPKPNLYIRDPQFATQLEKVRASYFGYSLNLRPNGIIVGAPRAQSTLESQRKVNETGAIYKCSLQTGACSPYIFDQHGNRNIEYSEYTYDSEMRDNQWLGGSMDGGTRDTDKLIVCAPLFKAPTRTDYNLHGICYWVPNTLGDSPANVTKISPLRLRTDQVGERSDGRYYKYILAEQGFSAHVTPDDEEFVIGAPGINNWKGSAIRHSKRSSTDDSMATRRDLGAALTRHTRALDYVDYEPEISYESTVLNPDTWLQTDDSYFGYAVGSGYFSSEEPKKLMYAATAPQANQQSGEAYIFDIYGKLARMAYVFRGQQFGEYFGYALLAVDLNGDNLTDVVISAPQYSFENSHDNGAIYVFINQGAFNFERKLIKSPAFGRARFGTTLAPLGDINHDGYNDIAVGAPFAGNGSVFIYLGSAHGIREQHSQRLDSPSTKLSSDYGSNMFGHGLSKGSDIDQNGFNDLAVGAPNAEAVLLYRAYPVVRVVASIMSETREIKPEQTSFQITACYGIATSSAAIKQQDLTVRLVLDPQAKRVKFAESQNNELSFKTRASTVKQCRVLDCNVRYNVADIFKPIELEMHYEVQHTVPDSEDFCDTCTAVDPADPKVYVEKIIFSTGCASSICVADLKLISAGLSSTYILGSSNVQRVNYEITNNGETAYLPQFNVTTSNQLPFAQIPSNCKAQSDVVLLCDLNRGKPMAKNGRDAITVSFDVSGLRGESMTIVTEVFSTGRELNPGNNKLSDIITLKEYTEIETTGYQTNGQINLEKYKNTAEIVNSYEIKSNGPSIISALELVFQIPIAYKIPGSQSITIPIVDVHNISMQAVYDAQLVGVDLIDQNNTHILMNTIEMLTSALSNGNRKQHKSAATVAAQRNVNYISAETKYQEEHFETVSSSFVSSSAATNVNINNPRRNRREMEAIAATREQYALISSARSHELLSSDFKSKLPVNRTIVFNCRDPTMTVCARAVLRVYNFKPEKPVTVSMRYNVNLNEINQLLIEPWEFFVVLIDLAVAKVGTPDADSLTIISKIQPNIISKHQLYGTPLWVIILAILGGLLVLGAITYAMYKVGFFKRTTKEEMDKLVHSGNLEPEAENLNAEN